MSRRPGKSGNKKQLPDQHTQKYHPGKDPLEQEASLMDIRPLAKVENKRIMQVVNKMLEQPNLSGEERKALRAWKAQMSVEGVKDTVQQEFLRNFWGWMIGRGKEEDHLKTPWYRQSLADDKEVAAYIDLFVTKMHDFKLKLKLLEVRRPIGINQVYLYYKYLICGKDTTAENFLDDWQFLMNEFTEARNDFGQDWMDKKDFPYPHETAPYGDVRKQLSERRTKKLADRDVKGLSDGLGDGGGGDDDSSSDDDQPPKGRPPGGKPPPPPPQATTPVVPFDDHDMSESDHEPEEEEIAVTAGDVNKSIMELVEELKKGRAVPPPKEKEEAHVTPSQPKPPAPPGASAIPKTKIPRPVPPNPDNRLAIEGKMKSLEDNMRKEADQRYADLEDRMKKLQERSTKLLEEKEKEKEHEKQKHAADLVLSQQKNAKELAAVQKELEENRRRMQEIQAGRTAADEAAKLRVAVAESQAREAQERSERANRAREGDKQAFQEFMQYARQRFRDMSNTFLAGAAENEGALREENRELLKLTNDLREQHEREGMAQNERHMAEQMQIEAKMHEKFYALLEKNGQNFDLAVSEALHNFKTADQAQLQQNLVKIANETTSAMVADLEQFAGEDVDLQDLRVQAWADTHRLLSQLKQSLSSMSPADVSRVIGDLHGIRMNAVQGAWERVRAKRFERASREASEFIRQEWNRRQQEAMAEVQRGLAAQNRRLQDAVREETGQAIRVNGQEQRVREIMTIEEMSEAGGDEEGARSVRQQRNHEQEILQIEHGKLQDIQEDNERTNAEVEESRKRGREEIEEVQEGMRADENRLAMVVYSELDALEREDRGVDRMQQDLEKEKEAYEREQEQLKAKRVAAAAAEEQDILDVQEAERQAEEERKAAMAEEDARMAAERTAEQERIMAEVEEQNRQAEIARVEEEAEKHRQARIQADAEEAERKAVLRAEREAEKAAREQRRREEAEAQAEARRVEQERVRERQLQIVAARDQVEARRRPLRRAREHIVEGFFGGMQAEEPQRAEEGYVIENPVPAIHGGGGGGRGAPAEPPQYQRGHTPLSLELAAAEPEGQPEPKAPRIEEPEEPEEIPEPMEDSEGTEEMMEEEEEEKKH